MIKTAVIGPLREEDMSHVRAFSDRYDLHFYRSANEADLSDTEVIIGTPPCEKLREAKNLRWLQLLIAGTDSYASCADLLTPIAFTNASGAFGISIAEHVLTMIMCLYKSYPAYRDAQRAHRWSDFGTQYSPRGKRVLIVGAGDIGLCTARILRPFGCTITGIRRTPRACPAEFDAMYTPTELDSLLPQQDIVICALPGTRETVGLMNRSRLALLRPDALFINVGRGSSTDNDALAEMLYSGRLFGAALDVTNPEPLPPDHPLWDAPNCIILPHVTGGSFGHLGAVTDRIMDIVTENMEHYAGGETLINKVDLRAGYRFSQD